MERDTADEFFKGIFLVLGALSAYFNYIREKADVSWANISKT